MSLVRESGPPRRHPAEEKGEGKSPEKEHVVSREDLFARGRVGRAGRKGLFLRGGKVSSSPADGVEGGGQKVVFCRKKERS